MNPAGKVGKDRSGCLRKNAGGPPGDRGCGWAEVLNFVSPERPEDDLTLVVVKALR
jgi:hypothetical protein